MRASVSDRVAGAGRCRHALCGDGAHRERGSLDGGRRARPRGPDAAGDGDEVAEDGAAAAGPPAPGPSNATRPTGSPSTSTRLRTPSQRPNGEFAGTAVGTTDASIAPSSARRVVGDQAQDPTLGGQRGDVLGRDAGDARGARRARVVAGRLPTAAGSSQPPNASRARITSLLSASSPSTSAVGSASA